MMTNMKMTEMTSMTITMILLKAGPLVQLYQSYASTPFPRWKDRRFFGRRKIVKIHPLHRSSASGLIWFSEVLVVQMKQR